MANVRIINSVEIDDLAVHSNIVHGHQGAAGGLPTTPEVLSSGGNARVFAQVLADATAFGLWATGETPGAIDYLWIKTYTGGAILEIISGSGGVRVPLTAEVPFTWAGAGLIADDFTTTAITADPTTEAITDVNLWNNSAGAIQFHAIIQGAAAA